MKIYIKTLCILIITALIINSQPPAMMVKAAAVVTSKYNQGGQTASGTVRPYTPIQSLVKTSKIDHLFLASRLSGIEGAVFASTWAVPNQTQRVADYFEARQTIQQQVVELSVAQTKEQTAKSNLYAAIVARTKGEQRVIPPAECPAGACDAARSAVKAAQSVYDIAKEASNDAKKVAVAAAGAELLAAAAVAAAYLAAAACGLLPPFANVACTLIAVLVLRRAQAYLATTTAALGVALVALAGALTAEAAALAALTAAEAILAKCEANNPNCTSPQVCTSTGCKDPTPTPGPSPTPGPTATPCPGGSCSSNGNARLLDNQLPEGASLAKLDRAGGAVRFENVNLVVEVPREAVSGPVTLVYQPQPRIPVLGMKPLLFFTLEAYNQVGCNAWAKSDSFKQAIQIRYLYALEALPGIEPQNIRLYVFNNSMNQWFPLTGTNDPNTREMVVKVDHFPSNATLYAIMASGGITANN